MALKVVVADDDDPVCKLLKLLNVQKSLATFSRQVIPERRYLRYLRCLKERLCLLLW